MQQSLTTVLPAVVNWPFVYFSTSGLLARPVTAFTCFTLPDQMLKHTALFDAHRKHNAKLVDFGGWEMPLHYGSQIAEHHSVRRDAGMFDVSHMLSIDVLGKGARSFLLELLANNVDRLKRPGKALYTCMLNSQAGVIDDLIVYFVEDDRFRLVVNAGTAEKDVDWITRQRDRIGLAVDIVPHHDFSMIAVQGPNAREKFWRAWPAARAATANIENFFAAQHDGWMIARTGYTGEDGFEITLPASDANQLWNALLEYEVVPAGLGARDTLRLEAGMNLYGQDMDEGVTPLESGLGWTVDLKSPRDFIGKKALVESRPDRKLVGLVLRERGVLRAHQKVIATQGNGEITSGTFSPTLGISIALARVPLTVESGSDVRVEVRGRLLRATAVKYPFVRYGQSLVDSELTQTKLT
jgi:aminomethyltransferase